MPFISNGTTILDNGAFSVSLGNLVHISTQTTAGATSVDFTSGIDSTYPIYIFEIPYARCSNAGRGIDINFSSDGGSNFNVQKTVGMHAAMHKEDNSSTSLSFIAPPKSGGNATGQIFLNYTDAGDGAMSAQVILYNPSSTTFVKHFNWNSNGMNDDNSSNQVLGGGYCNTTSAIDAVRFDTFDGNIIGKFKMYGVKGS